MNVKPWKVWAAMFGLIIIPIVLMMEMLPADIAVAAVSGWLGVIAWPAAESWAQKW